jgi:hypothetical protein
MPRLVDKQLRPTADLDFSVLPTNTFDLRGEEFYSFVEEITCGDVQDLLRVQKISNARCFLNTNALAFFDIRSDDAQVTQLQNRLSITVLGGKKVVLAGVHGYLQYLQDLLRASLTKRANKRISSNDSSLKNNLLHQVPSTPMEISSPLTSSSSTASPSTNHHHNFLHEKIQSWWEKNRGQYDLENHTLTEPDDYRIILNEKSALVKCSCNKQINIPMLIGRKHYQLSNFYKHLTQAGQCTAIERKRKRTEPEDEDDSATSVPPPSASTLPDRSHAHGVTQVSQQSTPSNGASSGSTGKRKQKRYRRS